MPILFIISKILGRCNSSSEYMLNNRYDETCDIADMIWSLHYLAEICDDAACKLHMTVLPKIDK
ncbi:MAG: hypothetical protein IJ021_08715 [Clostridia bacterium]|nr:hypothetical protein [Clostridia bacterium]